MYTWQFAKAIFTAERHGWAGFVSMQNHYNLVYREEEREMIPLCLDQGIGVVPWSPLARGLLAGTRSREGGRTLRSRNDSFADQLYDESDFAVVDVLNTIAEERGLPSAQIALAWLLGRPAVTAPVIGASRVEHVDDAIAALSVRLDPEESRRLEAPYRPHTIRGHS